MIILGIDPGLATTGYGVLDVDPYEELPFATKNSSSKIKKTIIDFGCLVTAKEMEEGNRLNKLYLDTKKLVKSIKPDVITIERLFFFKNAKTIITVGQARGVVILASAQEKIPVIEYAPLQIKAMIVGYGRAKKKEVEKKVKEILHKRQLHLKKGEKSKDGHHLDDAVDALAVAICHTMILQRNKNINK